MPGVGFTGRRMQSASAFILMPTGIAQGERPHPASLSTAAGRLADCIVKAAALHLPSMKLRGDWSDGDVDHEEGFYLLRHTLCPCVLSENGFMTNEQECRWLMTEEAIEAIAMTHVEGINGYLNDNK